MATPARAISSNTLHVVAVIRDIASEVSNAVQAWAPGGMPRAHVVEDPDGVVWAGGFGEREEKPAREVGLVEEGEEKERGGERVAEGEVAQEGAGVGVVARVRREEAEEGEGGVERVRRRQGAEECEGRGGQRGEAAEDGGEEGRVRGQEVGVRAEGGFDYGRSEGAREVDAGGRRHRSTARGCWTNQRKRRSGFV